MIPSLAIADDDPAADMALLECVADWAERYTPLVAIDPPQGLFLDITGCSHLFGGESSLIADVADRLAAQGFLLRAAIADTPAVAFAGAHFGSDSISIISSGGDAELLDPLPIAALRLDAEIVSALDRVGLKRIGQILAAPRAPLAARFGLKLLQRLDQALGIEEEATSPRRPVPALLVERRFAEPIVLDEHITDTLSSLASTLGRILLTRGLGARELEFSLFRVDSAVFPVSISAARPLRDAGHILAIFRERFSSLGAVIDPGFGFDMARLSVLGAAPMNAVQVDLSGDAFAEIDLDGLIDRIGARLGTDSVNRLVTHASHIPERTNEVQAPGVAAGHPTSTSPAEGGMIARPLRLFARPEPVDVIAEVPDGPPARFYWRRATYLVARAEGPERIAAEWWRDDDFTRDYFRVEDGDGRRFWLFRDGLYGRETNTPRWYLHGVFA
jgi:protein ImuB